MGNNIALNYLGIAIGGALGSLTRYGISTFWEHYPNRPPYLAVSLLPNIVGCALLGGIIAYHNISSNQIFSSHSNLKPLPAFWFLTLSIGYCGGLTTFSSFIAELFVLTPNPSFSLLQTKLLSAFISISGGFLSFGFVYSVLNIVLESHS